MNIVISHSLSLYNINIASFPGSLTLECKRWSCARSESLVVYLTWAVPRVERWW